MAHTDNYFVKFLKYMKEHGFVETMQQSYGVVRHKAVKWKRKSRFQTPTIVPKVTTASNKGVIYTCITGNYDYLPLHYYQDKNWDYVCFTDNPAWIEKGHMGHWTIKPLVFSELDTIRNARWHKIMAHELFPSHAYSIWLDGNIAVMKSLLFDKVQKCLDKNVILALPEHPERTCIYAELHKVQEENKEDESILKEVRSLLEQEKYPKDNGLHETNILVRKHNDIACKKIMEEWCDFIKNFSRRDQLSFDFVLWKQGVKSTTLFERGMTHPRRSTAFEFAQGKKHFSIAKKVKRAQTLSIIVPIYNALEDVQRCLESISAAQLPSSVDIILVNDASKEDTRKYLEQYIQDNPAVKLLHNEENLGFIKTCNKGMQQASGDVVVLLNSDTRIPSGFDERILTCFNSHSAIGIASPLSNCTAMWNLPYLDGKDFYEMDAYIEGIALCDYPMVPSPEGFCFCIRQEVIADIGYLDEIYGRGYCEENDFAFRALHNGWQGVIIDNLYVFHKRHASFGVSTRKQLMQENQKILWSRWKKLYKKACKEARLPLVQQKIHQNIYGHLKNNT